MDVTVRRNRLSSETGSELIEFAIVAPILILLLAGIFDFGMMFRTFEVVTNAAREGARVGVLPGYAPADVETRVDAFMAASGLAGEPYTVDVQTVPVATGAGTFTAAAVTVDLDYQMSILAPISAAFGGGVGVVSLRGASVMRTEAQAAP